MTLRTIICMLALAATLTTALATATTAIGAPPGLTPVGPGLWRGGPSGKPTSCPITFTPLTGLAESPSWAQSRRAGRRRRARRSRQ